MIRTLVPLTLLMLASDGTSARRPIVSELPSLPSLCEPGEFVIANCPVGRKLASVCGPRRGVAIYRFGRPGRIELTASGLRRTNMPSAGGGETQVYFKRGAFTYFLFDDMNSNRVWARWSSRSGNDQRARHSTKR